MIDDVINELKKFQKELDEKELPLSELQKWAGSINYCFILLIEEVHKNFEKLGILDDDEIEIGECKNEFYT